MKDLCIKCTRCGKLFYCNYDEKDIIICPYCNMQGQLSFNNTPPKVLDKYKKEEFYQQKKNIVIDDNVYDFEKNSNKNNIFNYILIMSILILIIAACLFVLQPTINNYFSKKPLEKIEDNVIENETNNIFMENVGFEFTDEREPTNSELFLMEESLNICFNSTFNDVVSFVVEDDLDDYIYEDWFDCDEYSYTLIDTARQRKMRCGIVTIFPTEIEWEDYDNNPPHVIVVFNTTDKGLVFVEPQLDDIFTLSDFESMQKSGTYYAEDDSYSEYLYYIDMNFDHYEIDWFYWYDPDCICIDCVSHNLPQVWNLYKKEYPDFNSYYNFDWW